MMPVNVEQSESTPSSEPYNKVYGEGKQRKHGDDVFWILPRLDQAKYLA